MRSQDLERPREATIEVRSCNAGMLGWAEVSKFLLWRALGSNQLQTHKVQENGQPIGYDGRVGPRQDSELQCRHVPVTEAWNSGCTATVALVIQQANLSPGHLDEQLCVRMCFELQGLSRIAHVANVGDSRAASSLH